jgi:hypothetical protein
MDFSFVTDKAKKADAKLVNLESSIPVQMDSTSAVGSTDSGPMRRQDIGGYPVSGFLMSLNFDGLSRP